MPDQRRQGFLDGVPAERRFDVLTGLTVLVAVLLNMSILSIRGSLLGGTDASADDAGVVEVSAGAQPAPLAEGEQAMAAAVLAESAPSAAATGSPVVPAPVPQVSGDPNPTPAAPQSAGPQSATPAPATPSPTTATPTTPAPTTAAPATVAPTTAGSIELLTYSVENFATVVVADHGGTTLELISVDTADGWGFRVERSTPTSLLLKFAAPGEDEVKWSLVRRGGQLNATTER